MGKTLTSTKEDDIRIYKSFDAGKWAVSGYGVISEPFNTPEKALEFILKVRDNAKKHNK